MPFEPQNALERSLVQATADPAYRPQFYKDFVKSNIFIIQQIRGQSPIEGTGKVNGP